MSVEEDLERRLRMDVLFKKINQRVLETNIHDMPCENKNKPLSLIYHESYWANGEEFKLECYDAWSDNLGIQASDLLIGFIAMEDVELVFKVINRAVSIHKMKKGEFVYAVDNKYPFLVQRSKLVDLNHRDKIRCLCAHVRTEQMDPFEHKGDFTKPRSVVYPFNERDAIVCSFGYCGFMRQSELGKAWREIYPVEKSGAYVMQPWHLHTN
jgi:hypothetical protein